MFSLKTYPLSLQEELSNYKAIINNPQIPEGEKEAFRQLLQVKEKQLKNEQSLKNRRHKTKKSFNSSKEWYRYFNQEWRTIQSALKNKLESLKAAKNEDLKVLKKKQKKSIKTLNVKFISSLQKSGLFNFNEVEKHNIFSENDGRKPFYAVLMDILESHFEARDFDYILKNPKNEKVSAKAMLATFKSNKSLPTVLNDKQLAYLEREIIRYLVARLKIKKTFVQSRKDAYQELMTELSDYAQGLPELSEPPRTPRLRKNYIKKYHKYKIEVDGLIFALGKSMDYNKALHAKLAEQLAINSDIKSRHMLRFISLARKSLDDKLWLKRREEYRKFYINFTNKENQIEKQIKSDLEDKKFDRSYLRELKKLAKQDFQNWVTNYLTKNQLSLDKYLKGGIKRLESWYGPLPVFPDHP